MKKSIIVILLSLISFSIVHAQEFMVDSIKSSQFIGLQWGGDMNQMLYLPYFTTDKSDKKNFIIRQLNPMSFTEEVTTRLELPTTYQLKKTAFNGTVYMLIFADDSKKEDVIITVSNGNIIKKKTFKQDGSTYLPFNLNSSEHFIIATISNKGNYQLEAVDVNLDAQWKKSYNASSGITWNIVSIKSNVIGLEIIRKETKANAAYSFHLQMIQPQDGEEIANTILKNDEFVAYPTNFSEKDGMKFMSGYYYKNSIFTKSPDAVFLASITPEGNIERAISVPYSQVIEDLKSTLGNKLSSPESAIVFADGTFSHETQTFFLTGQVMTRTIEEGGAKISISDFVTLKFNLENTYQGATSIKSKEKIITLKGDLSKTNILDLGVWIKNAGLLPFKYYTRIPGQPLFAFEDIEENNHANLCFKNSGLTKDTNNQICAPITREPIKQFTFNFPGTIAPLYPTLAHALHVGEHDIMRFTLYELNKEMLLLKKFDVPPFQNMDMIVTPPAMPDTDEGRQSQKENNPE